MNPLAQAPNEPPQPEPPAQPPEAGAIAQQPANAPAVVNKVQGRQDLISTLAVLGVVLIGVAIVLSLLRYWTRRQTQEGSPSLTLSSFREMYENGELSAEEYEQIRNKMAAKMKNKLGVKPLPAIKPKPDVGRNGAPPAPESES